jgi:hypothetical protein
MRLNRDAMFALTLLAVVLYFVVAALEYDELARQVPLIVGIPVAVLLVVQVLTQVFPGALARFERADQLRVVQVDEQLLAQAEATVEAGDGKHEELEFYGWIAGFIAAIYLFGFLTAIPLFMTAILFLRLGEGVWVAMSAAALMWMVAYLGFEKLMEVPLFTGAIWSLLQGTASGM